MFVPTFLMLFVDGSGMFMRKNMKKKHEKTSFSQPDVPGFLGIPSVEALEVCRRFFQSARGVSRWAPFVAWAYGLLMIAIKLSEVGLADKNGKEII